MRNDRRSAYLVAERYTGGVISCATGGCETVQQSRYAVLAGIPVAVLGLVGYLVIFGLSFVRGAAAQAATLALALAAWVFGGYLLYVQAFLIHAFCDWCLVSDALLTLIVAVSLVRTWRMPGGALHPASG